MYREPYYREGPTPRGSRRGRYWSERVKVDPDRVYDSREGRWRKLRDDEIAIPVPMKITQRPPSGPTRVAPSTSDWGQMVQTRQPHMMSTADLLRERYSGVVAYPGRTAEILSELERRKVFDPEGLAIKWHIL